MTLVKRDCFAREELHKESRTNLGFETNCAFCGGSRILKKSGKKQLWEFFVHTDGGSKYKIDHLFCSVDCYKNYYA